MVLGGIEGRGDLTGGGGAVRCPSYSPSREREGGLLFSCARATRGLRRMGWAAWSSSCSRNRGGDGA